MRRAEFYVGDDYGVFGALSHAQSLEREHRAAEALGTVFGGCTVFRALGAWNGTTEHTRVFVVVTAADDATLNGAAEQLRAIYEQQEVLWAAVACVSGSAQVKVAA